MDPREFSAATQARYAADRTAAQNKRLRIVNRQRFDSGWDKTVERHPEIAPEIFNDIKAAYAKGSGSNLQKDYDRIYYQILKKYPEQGEQAMQALAYELRGETMLTKGIKLFYNSDKGGVQPGGFAGAALGFGAFMMLTGGGGQGLLGLASLALGTLVGAWWGNKGVDKLKSMIGGHKPPPTPAAGKTPEAAPKAPAKETPYYEPPGDKLSLGDTGTLPSPSLPKATPSGAGRQTPINHR